MKIKLLNKTLILFVVSFMILMASNISATEKNKQNTKSVAVALQFGPFEEFPKGGLSIDFQYQFHKRFSLASKITYFFIDLLSKLY